MARFSLFRPTGTSTLVVDSIFWWEISIADNSKMQCFLLLVFKYSCHKTSCCATKKKENPTKSDLIL